MNEMNPTLSIITVTYNAEKTLPFTLKSVAEQTYRDIQYILIDGKSRDNTLLVIEESNVSIHALVSEPDKGLYDAMNKGAALATGDYICFLNAGDTFFAPDTVERMMKSIPQGELPGVIYGETALVSKQRFFVGMRWHRAPDEMTWKSFLGGMLVSHQAFILKRDLFEPYELSYRFSSDVDWCIRMMKKTNNIYNSHLTLINYLNEGMTTSNHKASLKERFRIMVKHYGALPTLIQHGKFFINGLKKKLAKKSK
ncbi:MAG: putative glycosyltransferase [Bacteroidetes bacterium]|jgi:glycosyltransferase involved in cell wall biosynthesis|nr:putative glycosyltransferase [Bacteroidota bacterium]